MHTDVNAQAVDFDVVIAGGGLVGSSLACALDGSGLRVALIEASAPRQQSPPSFDERNLALNRFSLEALSVLGVLPHLASAPARIRGVHVSCAGDFGRVRLRCEDHGVDAFGGVVVARELGGALQARLDACSGLALRAPARVLHAQPQAEAMALSLDDGSALRARLLVIADGSDSALREQLGLGSEHHDYGQTLFVSVVEAAREHAGIAYERFTDEGPVAMLPLAGRRLGSVLTIARERADAVIALADADYLELLQQRFGWRLGRLQRVGRRSAYPMRLITARQLVGPRCVALGNAAQTLHPIGAQGFNLGLRDALTLAGALRAPGLADPGASALLQRHAELRAPDRARTLDFSDGLARLFTHRAAPVRWLRGLGLAAFDHFSDLARPMVRGAMGHDLHAEAALRLLREAA
ncbi:MAG: 2-octaprenyl-6-methoxyphenyl hydroxylase [Aquimonas sp.]|nr:2-octaprenyl-6-methoxyphenyl hydroxylase [Aquimonas sp.]